MDRGNGVFILGILCRGEFGVSPIQLSLVLLSYCLMTNHVHLQIETIDHIFDI
jgi:hypothetical protein